MKEQREQDEITITVALKAPITRVWEAWTDQGHLRLWWPGVTLDARVGGAFIEPWERPDGQKVHTRGKVLEIEPPRLLKLTWADEDWTDPTTLAVMLREHDGETLLRLVHSGWEHFPDAAARIAEHRAGWTMHLDNLRRHLKSDPGTDNDKTPQELNR